jgi:3-phosphoshikimate 1-carboxyvinyltransferase
MRYDRAIVVQERSELVDEILIRLSGPLDAVIRVPGSKSITNRALVAAALACGTSCLRGALDARDTRLMAKGLSALGAGIGPVDGAGGWTVVGTAGRPTAPAVGLDLEDCGTGARILTAVSALADGPCRVDGSPRLRERPLGPLLTALRDVGVAVTCTASPDHLPIVVDGSGLRRDAAASISGEFSSQFTSALLLAGPGFGLDLTVSGHAVSRPYVALTVSVMEAFGGRVTCPSPGRFVVERGTYLACGYEVEGDASAAAFWLGAAAIAGGRVAVENVPASTTQADAAIVRHLVALGCETDATASGLVIRGPATRGADLDLRDSPDLMPVLAAVAATVPERTRLRGAPHLVHKESDRIAAMADVLTATGVTAEARSDGLDVIGGQPRGAEIDPRDDHRIAMAAAVLGLAAPGMVVRDPGCVAKSYPSFFEDLGLLVQDTSA